MEDKWDLFISYSSKNQDWAFSFRDQMQKRKLKAWMAPDSIPVGSRYAAEINKAVMSSSCFVLLHLRNLSLLKENWN